MEVLSPVCGDGHGGEVDEEDEAEVKGHGVACCIVEWDTDEGKDGGVENPVEVTADPGCPELGPWQRNGVL